QDRQDGGDRIPICRSNVCNCTGRRRGLISFLKCSAFCNGIYLYYSRKHFICQGGERLTLVSIFLRLLLLGCWALRLATLPVFGEQIEKYLLSWMLANDLFVQCDAETWSMRQCEAAIHHFGIAGRSSLDPLSGNVVEVLLDF